MMHRLPGALALAAFLVSTAAVWSAPALSQDDSDTTGETPKEDGVEKPAATEEEPDC